MATLMAKPPLAKQQAVSVSLRAGEQCRLPVEAGSVVWVRSGRVALRTPPEWLAEQVLAPEIRLVAEEVYTVGVIGWADLAALSQAEVLLVPGRPQPGCLGLLWQALVAGGRRVLAAGRLPGGRRGVGAAPAGDVGERVPEAGHPC